MHAVCPRGYFPEKQKRPPTWSRSRGASKGYVTHSKRLTTFASRRRESSANRLAELQDRGWRLVFVENTPKGLKHHFVRRV